MAKKLENIFNECLERVHRGESIESCLQSYPKEAAELEPLLRTALGFIWRASAVQPRPEFKARARLRLQGVQVYAREQKQPARPGSFAWQRGWAFALTAVLVILLTGAGTAAASSDALPDEPLYPVKLATEQVRLAFTFSDANEAKLHAQLAENRALEIAAMARQGNTEQVDMVTERLAGHLEEANYAVQKVEKTGGGAPQLAVTPQEAARAPELVAVPDSEETEGGNAQELKRFIEASASKNLAVLQDALEQAPEQTKPALQRAIEIVSEERLKSSPQPDTKAEDEDNDKNGNQGESQPTPVQPNQSQPSSRKTEDKDQADPALVEPRQTEPSFQETEEEDKAEPTPVQPKQVQPSTQETEPSFNSR
jgi:hypothetical protein